MKIILWWFYIIYLHYSKRTFEVLQLQKEGYYSIAAELVLHSSKTISDTFEQGDGQKYGCILIYRKFPVYLLRNLGVGINKM